MKLNLVMPMGGGGTRFGNANYERPKPLIEIYGKPFFYWAAQSVLKFIPVETLTFVILRDHVERFQIDKKIIEFYPDANLVVIPEVLPGAVMTCLAATQNIRNDGAILFNDCDHLFLCGAFSQFCTGDEYGAIDRSTIDGGILTFQSSDSRFSYVAYGRDGFVTRTVEKQVISQDAICGAYYFRNRDIFEHSALDYLKQCTYSEFFLSGVYNVLAEKGGKIRSFPVDHHVSFGTPEEYERAKQDLTFRLLQ